MGICTGQIIEKNMPRNAVGIAVDPIAIWCVLKMYGKRSANLSADIGATPMYETAMMKTHLPFPQRHRNVLHGELLGKATLELSQILAAKRSKIRRPRPLMTAVHIQ